MTKIDVDYGEALSRPFQDIKKLIIGCLLNIIPIVNFFAIGFVADAAKMTLGKKKNLPEWDNWGDLFMKGLMVFLVGLIWVLPMLVLMGIGFGGMWGSMMSGAVTGSMPGFFSLGSFGIAMVLGVIVGIVISYLSPLAVLAYIKSGNFGDAFEFRKIIDKAMNADYFIVWLVWIVISVVLSAIAGAIPFLSLVLTPAASFIAMLIGMTLIGSVYNSL
jgi:hypothetical protein